MAKSRSKKRNTKRLHIILVISFSILFVCALFLIRDNFFGKNTKVVVVPIPTIFPTPTIQSLLPTKTKSITPAPIVSSSTKLSYFLPNGWVTQNDSTQTFQVGYDPASFDATSQEKFVSVTRKNLEQSPYYSPYANTTQFSIEPYDNGSRHSFIEKQLGEVISSANKTPSYKEKNLTVAGKNCLIISGISISQFPDNWGMCPISSTKAILITTFNTDVEVFLKTLKFL